MKRYAFALSVVLLIATFAPGVIRAASDGPVNYVLTTWQKDVAAGGQYNGVLRISIQPNGVVSGTMMTTQGDLSQVVGGLSGKKIWLQIGNHSPGLQKTYQGTFVDGKLLATAQGVGLHTWTLEGEPAK